MKWSPNISNFLEEISSLFHSVIFLYFFVLVTEESFLLSPCYSLEHCIQICFFFFFPFVLCLSLLFFFQLISKASSDSHFAFFAFLFLGDGLDHCLKPPSIVLPSLYYI